MLVHGTQMHLVTFGFVCLELVILFWLIIYRLARRDDQTTYLDIRLIFLLLFYNIASGLLPDENLPGSNYIQNSIAYGSGFITPSYFPYYVYTAFTLHKMRFHVKFGVYFFLLLPYLLFVAVYGITGSLKTAQNLLIIPAAYGFWVIVTLTKSVRYKYRQHINNSPSNAEIVVLYLSLTPWVGLPFITYFNASQWVEAFITNSGFLLLFAYHLRLNIKKMKDEHQRLIESEKRLTTWNEELQAEVLKRTLELEKISKEERFRQNCDRFNLSTREKEIARLICSGLAYREIGQQVHIAETTVAKHAQNIFEKAGVSNKMELCAKLETVLPSA